MEGRERDVKRERVGAPLALSNPNMKNLFRQSDSAFPDFPFFGPFLLFLAFSLRTLSVLILFQPLKDSAFSCVFKTLIFHVAFGVLEYFLLYFIVFFTVKIMLPGRYIGDGGIECDGFRCI